MPWLTFQQALAFYITSAFLIQILKGFHPFTVQDYITVNHVYRMAEARDWMSCIQVCYTDEPCASYNYKYSSPKDGNYCELSHCGVEEDKDRKKNLVFSLGFVFQQLKPIKNKQMCTQQPPKTKKGSLYGSTILTVHGNPSSFLVMHSFLTPVLQDTTTSRWVRCYHADTDGWRASTFHSKCDAKGPTVVIVRVNKHIFGGYTSTNWESNCTYLKSDTAFLFSIINNEGYNPIKLPLLPGKHGFATYGCVKQGPAFGHGFDFVIEDNANSTSASYTRCNSYLAPPTCSSDTMCAFFAGKDMFTPSDLEVFFEQTS